MRNPAFALAGAATATALLAGCGEAEPVGGSAAGPTASPALAQAGATRAAEARPETTAPRLALGTWSAKTERGQRMALYGEAGTEAALTVRCDAGDVVLSRSVALGQGPVPVTVIVGEDSEQIGAMARTDPLPSVSARLPATWPIARRLAQAARTVTVQVPGAPSLTVLASEQLRAVVRGCLP